MKRIPISVLLVVLISCLDYNKMQAQILNVVAGNGYGHGSSASGYYSGDGGAAVSASLALPAGLALDKYGNIYMADYGNNRIRKVSAATGIISTIAGTGSAGFSGDHGLATAAMLNGPTCIAVDDAANVCFFDQLNSRIRKIDGSTGIITTVVGNGSHGGAEWGYPGTIGDTLYNLIMCSGLSFDASGHLLINVSSSILTENLSTRQLGCVAGCVFPHVYFNDGKPADSTAFYNAQSLALDPAGNIYFSTLGIDSVFSSAIRKVDISTGIISTYAGADSAGYGGDGEHADSALFNYPIGLVFDKAGNLYVSDSHNQRVRRIQAGTKLVSTFAGRGVTGYGSFYGPPDSAYIDVPFGIAADTGGNIYFAAQLDNIICEVVLNATCLPTVRISANAADTICTGTQVSYTATVTNGGPNPIYQWQVNGANIGTNSSTFTDTLINDSDAITCKVTSGLNCDSGLVAHSNAIIMTVGDPLVPGIAIGTDSSICSGNTPVLHAIIFNGGNSPFYQWKVNGNNFGTDTNAVTYPGLTNGDTITCVLISSLGCAVPVTVTSGKFTRPDTLSISSITTHPPTCFGGDNASACIYHAGGTNPVTYTWSPYVSVQNCIYTSIPAGTYDVTLTDRNNCSISAAIIISQPPSFTDSFSVAGVRCFGDSNGFACLFPGAAGVPPYTYRWSNGDTTSCATNLSSAIYTATVTDAHGCPVADTVIVSHPAQLNLQVNTPDSNAVPDSVTLVITGGISPYSIVWDDGQTNTGVGISVLHVYSAGGNYTDTITDARGCTQLYHVNAGCYNQCVWPGDANYDGMVNNSDLLPIGLAYDSSGYLRINPTIDWIPQYCQNWIDSLQDSINYKHIDCNGDGIINAADTQAIIQNYSFTHARSGGYYDPRAGITALIPKVINDSIYNGDTLTVQFLLGSLVIPANHVYGLAFTLNYDVSVVDTLKTKVVFGNSWLGTSIDKISIAKDLRQAGELQCALTRIDHTTKSGQGSIGTASFVITTDNLNGKDYSFHKALFYITEITMIDSAGNVLPVGAGIDSTEIGYLPTGIHQISGVNSLVHIYPNPASNQLVVTSGALAMEGIKVMDVIGNVVINNGYLLNAMMVKQVLDISDLNPGVYMVEILTSKGVAIQKLIVAR